MERAFPGFTHLPPAVLRRLRTLAVAREHGILRTGDANVTLHDLIVEFIVEGRLAHLLELIVQIEDDGGGMKAPRRAARMRVQADAEETFPGEAQ